VHRQALGRGRDARGREGVPGRDRVPHPPSAGVRVSGAAGTGPGTDGGEVDAARVPEGRRELSGPTSHGAETREHAESAGSARAAEDAESPRGSGTAGAAAEPTSPDTMREHHITVPRTARYHTLGRSGPELEQLWFVCHGYG